MTGYLAVDVPSQGYQTWVGGEYSLQKCGLRGLSFETAKLLGVTCVTAGSNFFEKKQL